MYRYNEEAKPPAPYCDTSVSDSALSRQVTLTALIDTGSDISAIPPNTARGLGLQFLGTGIVEGISGEGVVMPMFEAFLSLDQRAWERFEVLGWQEDFALLGRDILNNYRITLDGPTLTLTIERP